jgi:hypothetical protein
MISLRYFNEEDVNVLTEMLEEFATETFGTEEPTVDVDQFVDGHSYIYLIIRDSEVIGFTSFTAMDYYGMRDMVLNHDYLYVRKGHRRSKAMHIVNLQAGKIIDVLKCNLSIPLANGTLEQGLNRRIKSKLIYSTYEYRYEDVATEYDRLQKKIYKDK